jgi:hypothetical protein
MSRDNPLWGSPRIHGELLKLGIDTGENQCQQVYGPKSQAAFADLKDLPE